MGSHGGIPDGQSVNWLQHEILTHLASLDRKLDDIAVRLDMGGAAHFEQKQVMEAKLDTQSPQPPRISSKDQLRPSKRTAASEEQPSSAPQLSTLLLSKPSTSLSKRMPSGDTMVDAVHAPALETVRERGSEYELTEESDTCRVGQQVCDQPTDSTRETVCARPPEDVSEAYPLSPGLSQKPFGSEPSVDFDRGSSIGSSKGAEYLADKSQVGQFRENMWQLFEDPESSRFAKYYAIFTRSFVMVSVCFTLMQSLPSPPIKGIPGAVGEIIVEAFFLVELLIRFASCPSRWTFVKCRYNLIDVCAVIPLVLRYVCGFVIQDVDDDSMLGFAQNILLCVVPVLRLLKIIRRFERFQLLLHAFEMIFEALPVCLFPLAFITLLFSAAIYLVEPRDNIPTLWHAMWLTIVTMTTVGYGDITPSQAAGSIVVSVLVVSSVLYMAMPLGIIGQAFTEVWRDRDRILLMKRAKQSLSNWGYKPSQIPHLFQMFDDDGSGELELHEFQEMMSAMRIGLSQERVIQIFNSIDIDCGGSVDSSEFLTFLFPESQYVDICKKDNAVEEKPLPPDAKEDKDEAAMWR